MSLDTAQGIGTVVLSRLSITVLAALLVMVTGSGILASDAIAAAASADPAQKAATTDAQRSTLDREWGIQILGISLTAANYMLDFRYRVLEPEKAGPIVDRTIKPHLIVENTGDKLQVPVSYKVGPMRASAKFAKADRNYFVFFANPGQVVKAGDKVTVVVGDFRAEHLTVQ